MKEDDIAAWHREPCCIQEWRRGNGASEGGVLVTVHETGMTISIREARKGESTCHEKIKKQV
jgi:hypothetical protein